MADGNRPHLILTDENEYSVELADWAMRSKQQGLKWVTRQIIAHAHPAGRPSITILPGARVIFPSMFIDGDYECLVTFGAALPGVSRDGLEMSLEFREVGLVRTTELLRYRLLYFNSDHPYVERKVDLTPLINKRGQFIIACGPSAEMDGQLCSLALYEFVVSPAEELTLNRARAFAAFREKNEIALFSTTYKHPIYNQRVKRPIGLLPWALTSKTVKLLQHAGRRLAAGIPMWIGERLMESSDAAPCRASTQAKKAESPAGNAESILSPNLNLSQYYTSRLMQELEIKEIDFRSYLSIKLKTHAERPIRILSLASGAARIEEGIINGFDPERIELMLTDINPDLLAKARARLSDKARLQIMEMNVNQLCLPSRSFDVIICVSALHHLVELERVMSQTAAALVEDGEFWSIGEYIGRNGTRLFEDAYSVANEYFRQLPRKYRINRNPGSKGKVDECLPNFDCSITCFEGIRSEEIEAVIDRYFAPLEVIKFDCFLWRFFNLAYLDNYDLEQQQDREIVERAIQLEKEFVLKGGRPTAMFGVFRRKLVLDKNQ